MPRVKQIKLPKGTKVPNHIAIILDGNGRWARSRGLPVTKGHEAGAKAVDTVLRTCRNLGVHTLTIWGWSTENWKRPPAERKKIMELVHRTIKNNLAQAHKDSVRFVHLGRKDRLPSHVMGIINKAEEETKNYKKYILNIALDYGGRDELMRAMKKMVAEGKGGDDINEEMFADYLDTAGQPYPFPDLFIRTSGEMRTSGYLPWQMVYTEFYFEEDHLPDMTPEKVVAAIMDYSRRRRRFGAKDKGVKHLQFKPEITARFEVDWWRLANIPEDETFTHYAYRHVKELYGLSKGHAKDAAKYLVAAVAHGEKSNWKKATLSMTRFYKLVRDELKLAFEPSLVASLDVKLLQRANGGTKPITAEYEADARRYLAEVYRISDFQAKKAARLRTLAVSERQMAEAGKGDKHWDQARTYLEKYYAALKDRVA